MKKENNFIEKTRKYIKENPKSKTWAFFGFYFIFFSIIIMSLRSNYNNVSNNDNNNKNSLFSIGQLKSNNYHFKYNLNIDNIETIYEGDIENLKEKFNITKLNNNEKYFGVDNEYFKYDGVNWIGTDNPYIIITPRYDEILENIFTKATYISKTENIDNTKIYNYQISTTTLNEIIDLENVDIEDIPNEIRVFTDSNNEVIKLEYNLSSYSKFKNICINNLTITVEYSNYGEINNINRD